MFLPSFLLARKLLVYLSLLSHSVNYQQKLRVGTVKQVTSSEYEIQLDSGATVNLPDTEVMVTMSYPSHSLWSLTQNVGNDMDSFPSRMPPCLPRQDLRWIPNTLSRHRMTINCQLSTILNRISHPNQLLAIEQLFLLSSLLLLFACHLLTLPTI